MLVSLTLENWMSFRDPMKLSMVASRERQHSSRMPSFKKYDLRILPISAVYGPNASGKSNIVKAVQFVKYFVSFGVRHNELIPVEPFRTQSNEVDLPTRFTFEIISEETIYEYSFSLNQKRVIDEKLVEINSRSEKVLYQRDLGTFEFDKSFDKTAELHYVARGTQDNQLFLTNSISQRVTTFKAVYDWFYSTLVTVFPESRFEPLEQFIDENSDLVSSMNELLPKFHCGVQRLTSKPTSLDELNIDESVKAQIRASVGEGSMVRMQLPHERILFSRKDGELIVEKLATVHLDAYGNEVIFDFSNESDGTQRVIDLLPAIIELVKSDNGRVYVIDELDRSLHSVLSQGLIQMYLSSCAGDTRSQLIFTTHDLHLMDQELFRRDELRLTERLLGGASSLTSISAYRDIRYDKDIRKIYLEGKLGSVPFISQIAQLSNQREPEFIE